VARSCGHDTLRINFLRFVHTHYEMHQLTGSMQEYTNTDRHIHLLSQVIAKVNRTYARPGKKKMIVKAQSLLLTPCCRQKRY
jgi:hypothetical protein